MIKVKDGYAKIIGTTYSGSAARLLLSNGGDKAVSDFATSTGVVTALGTKDNYVTWTKNGTVNNLVVPYAAVAEGISGIYSAGLPTSFSTGRVTHHYNILSGTKGLFPNTDNANSILTVNRHAGNYLSQLGFSSNKKLYFRSASGADINSVAWSTVLTSSNYTDYTVKKDGTGASGTWGINISGTAANADKLDGIDSTGFLRQVVVANNTTNDFNTFGNMTLTGRVDPTTGASLVNAPWTGGGPAGGYGVLTYLFNGSGYGTQMAWGYNSNRIYIRPRYYSNGPKWATTWDSLALTSDIPTKVSQLSNDAGYLTSLPSHVHTYIQSKDNYTFTASTLPNSFDWGISAGFVADNAGYGSYGSVLTVRTYTGGGGTLQLYAPYSKTYGGTRLKARFGDYDKSNGNSWTDLKEIAWTSDIPSSLKNPKSIKFKNTAGTAVSYDGSSEVDLQSGINYATLAGKLQASSNTITKTANDTTAKWGALHNTVHFYSTTGQLTDQPSQYGLVVNFNSGSEVHQLWLTQASGDAYHRGGNSSGWSGTWRKFLDSSNYTSYVNTTNFPGINKTGTVTSVTVTGSNGLSGTGTVTTSGTITLSNSGVRSTTINGNYLRVNTNGTNADLTIPYATRAGSASTASSANWLNTNDTLTYGASGLNYFNISGTAGNTKANNTPTSAWYHIIRMNHGNSGGYLADIAVPLNDVGGVWWRQIRNGSFYGWYKILDSNNYDDYVNTTNFPGLNKTGTVTSVKVGSTSYSPSSGVISLPAYPTNTNYYHTRVYSSGLKISTGTGVSDMYVPTGTTTTLGVVKQHTASDCTSYTSDEGATTPAAVKKAVGLFAVTKVSTGTGLTGGDITSTGTISINSTYQTYISHGNTAYGWGNHANAGYIKSTSILKGWSDTRSAATKPNDYNGAFKVIGIKSAGTTLGLTSTQAGSYATIIGWRGWSDSSGGYAWEIASTDKNRLYVRSGDTTSWNNGWQAIAYTSDIPTKTSQLTNNSGYITATSLDGYVNAIETSGSGNAITSASKSGKKITFTKGTTFLTAHQTIYALTIKNSAGTTQLTYTPNSAAGSITLTKAMVGLGNVANSTYAGGTKVTLNGTDKGASTASFYAPTTAGTSNYVLISGGTGTAPSWTAQSNLSVGTASKLGTATKGSATNPIYLSSGSPMACTYSLKATVNSGTTSKLAYYSGTNAVSAYIGTLGSSNRPIYLNAGVPTACTWGTGAGSSTTASYLISATSTTAGLQYNTSVRLYNNAVYSSYGFYESSDERLKTILNPVKVNLDELAKLRKVYYLWKDDSSNDTQLGVIAQDVQKLYPELVSVNSDTGYLSLSYDKLSVVALAAVDELHKTLNEVKEENKRLRELVKQLETKLMN